MWTSLQVRLPTLNGESGWKPKDWHLDDRSKDYLVAARQWVERNQIEDVCLYDEAARAWSRFR